MGFIFNDPKFIIGTNDIPSPIQMFKSFVIGGAVNEPTWQDVVISGVGALTLVNAKADGLNYVKMLGETRVNGVPNGYTLLESLTGYTSRACFDTGVSGGNDNLRIKFKASKAQLVSYSPFFGNYVNESTRCTRMICTTTTSGVIAEINRNAGDTKITNAVNPLVEHEYELYKENGVSILKVDGVIVDQIANVSGTENDRNIAFNAGAVANTESSATNTLTTYKYFQIYNGNTLIRDYIPLKDSNNVVGMYDRANGVFKPSKFDTQFTAGAVLYPTTDNPQDIYINNGIVRTFCGEKFTKAGQTTGVLLSSTGVPEPNANYNTTDYIFLKAGKYTVQWQDTVSGNRVFKICSYYDNDSFRELVFQRTSPGASLNTYTFTISYDTRVRISYRVSFSKQSVKPTETIYYLDNPVTETVTDSLNNTATVVDLYGVGNYKDSHEILTGNINQNVGIYAVTGAEVWTLAGTTGADGSKRIWMDFSTKDANVGLSNMFTIAPLASRDEEGMNNRFFMSGTTLHLRSDKFTSLADAKTWLANQYSAGTPVLVVYALKTPITSTTTAQTLNTSEGENTITITQASLPDLPLEVSYKAGVTVTITEIENANLDNQVTVTIT